MRKLDPEYLIPLSPIEFQILVALAGRPLYAYALIQECAADSEQIMTLSPGTLYPSLKGLERFGYVEVIGSERGEGSRYARRVYGLTATGQLILEQETSRLRAAVHLAEHRLAKIKS